MRIISTCSLLLLCLFASVFTKAQITTSSQWTWMKGDKYIDGLNVYGTKGVASPMNTPSARSGSANWKDANGNFWLYGGISQKSSRSDLWKFDPLLNQWTWVNGSSEGNQPAVYGIKGVGAQENTPGTRIDATSWTDANGDLWLFGGTGYEDFEQNDLWKYSPASNQWTWMTGENTLGGSMGSYGTRGVPAASNSPGTRISAMSWVDAAGDLWLFGGRGFGACCGPKGVLNDVWKYTVATNQWTWMSGSSITGQKGVYGTLGISDANNMPGARYSSVIPIRN